MTCRCGSPARNDGGEYSAVCTQWPLCEKQTWTFSWNSTPAEHWDLERAKTVSRVIADNGGEVIASSGGVDLTTRQADDSLDVECTYNASFQLTRLIADAVGHPVTAVRKDT